MIDVTGIADHLIDEVGGQEPPLTKGDPLGVKIVPGGEEVDRGPRGFHHWANPEDRG